MTKRANWGLLAVSPQVSGECMKSAVLSPSAYVEASHSSMCNIPMAGHELPELPGFTYGAPTCSPLLHL